MITSLWRILAKIRYKSMKFLGRPLVLVGSNESCRRFSSFYCDGLCQHHIRIVEKASLVEAIFASAVVAVTFVQQPFFFRIRIPGQFNCNPIQNHKAAWEACDLLTMITGSANPKTVKETFKQRIQALRKQDYNKAYIFGTGESLGRAIDYDWSDGFRIVCNTIVKNAKTWNHLKPHVIVAADAIYHFSNGEHAVRFRNDLKHRLLEHPALFMYPERFDAVVQREMKSCKDCLVPVPFAHHTPLSKRIDEAGGLPKSIGNILNVLLLPLACTLVKDVRLIGFDGRRKEDRLFWKNSENHSYPELVERLAVEYPAFFEHNVPKKDQEKYLRSVHGDVLEALLREAEQEGWKFRLLFPSNTPTLQRRYNGEYLPRLVGSI